MAVSNFTQASKRALGWGLETQPGLPRPQCLMKWGKPGTQCRGKGAPWRRYWSLGGSLRLPQTSVQFRGLMWIMLMQSSRSSVCGWIPPHFSQSQVTSRYSGAFTLDNPWA